MRVYQFRHLGIILIITVLICRQPILWEPG